MGAPDLGLGILNTMSVPWFTIPWQQTSGGVFARVGAALYIATGLAAIAAAATSTGGGITRAAWLLIASVFLLLGLTLAATLRWRRRSGQRR